MARPVVLVAWEPTAPEEALAVQEVLQPHARVEWIHELTSSLEREVFPETVAIVAGRWPARLTQALAYMPRLRLVSCVYDSPKDLPGAEFKARDVRVETGGAPAEASGPHEAQHHVAWSRAAAERVADFLRRGTYVKSNPSGKGSPL
jgi:hypothetical protein